MDIKITGITEEIMDIALEQAYEARAHILKEMAKLSVTLVQSCQTTRLQ